MAYNIHQHQANIFQRLMNRKYPDLLINVSWHPEAKRGLSIAGVTTTDPNRLVISYVIPEGVPHNALYWTSHIESYLRRFKDVYDKRSKVQQYKRWWFNNSGFVALRQIVGIDENDDEKVLEDYPKPADKGPWRQISFPIQEYRAINVNPEVVKLKFKRGLDAKARKRILRPH